MHRFKEAEAITRRLVTLREFVLDYGLLGDVLMEQGRLADAAVAYQKMIDLKPFYQSYTRAAHLRWLKGDVEGAIALMQAAVKAASPRDPESIAWAYTRLATYELQRGRFAEAERMTAASLQYVRKVSGSTKPSQANTEAFDRAVDEIAAATSKLLDSLVTSAPPKDREVEAAKRRARAAERYATA